MTAELKRIAAGLGAALLVATTLKFALIDYPAAPETQTAFATLLDSAGHVLLFGLTLGSAIIAITEHFRFRSVVLFLGLGALLAFSSAYLMTFGADLSAPAFAAGPMRALAILATGLGAAVAYWFLAGNHAGWRGDDEERSELQAANAFRKAGFNTDVEVCRECVVGWAVIGLFLFALLSWLSVDVSGLHDSLLSSAEARGKSVLEDRGHSWAHFRVDGDRGIIEGLAPDENQKIEAYRDIRTALAAVTGIPGIISGIDNDIVSKIPSASASREIEDAERRAKDAEIAIEAARMAAEAAKAAEAEAKRSAEENARRAEQAAERLIEERTKAAEEQMQRSLEEKTREVEAELQRKLAEQTKAAEQPVDVAAIDPNATDTASPDQAGAEAATFIPSGTCTTQDHAIIETSRILFPVQRFDIDGDAAIELDRLASSARACAPRPVLVSGYTDKDRDNVFNPALALQRAEAVRTALIARGVSPALVVAKSRPDDDTDEWQPDPEARTLKRSADFRLLEPSEISRDATLGPDERAATCEKELADIMSKSVIYFGLGSTRVTQDAMPLLQKLAAAIDNCGSVIVTVEGHTDRIGTEAANQILSEARANAVREALVGAGADQTRLAAKGFAASRPSSTGETAEAYALNRRIEFRVSGKFTSASTSGP